MPVIPNNKQRHLSYFSHLVFCLSFLFCSVLFFNAQCQAPKVSLITIGPGAEIYSSFGHSAIWISDPATGLDRNYNYGTFDFKTGNFYLKFLRGTLPYQIASYPLSLEFPYWQADNRRVTEQVLNLSDNQRKKLFQLLETNYLPENREYKYRFYHDNCSTRLRDMLQAACGDSLQYLTQPIDGTAKSYRNWMNDYLGGKIWAQFGMNAAIGAPADQTASPQQEMYLPNNLMKHLDKATLGGKPLVRETRVIFEPTPPEETPFWLKLLSFLTSPNVIAFGILGVILWVQFKKPALLNASFRFDKLFFGFVGFWGCFVLLLWVGTDHGVTAWNQNLLWLMPLHLPFALMLGKPKYHALLRRYVLVCLCLTGGAFVLGLVGFLKGTQWVPFNILFLFPLLLNRLAALRQRLKTTL